MHTQVEDLGFGKLIITTPRVNNPEYRIVDEDARLLVGRSRACNVVIKDIKISSRHCTLEVRAIPGPPPTATRDDRSGNDSKATSAKKPATPTSIKRVFVIDNDSANGTFVNGIRLANRTAYMLSNNDEISLSGTPPTTGGGTAAATLLFKCPQSVSMFKPRVSGDSSSNPTIAESTNRRPTNDFPGWDSLPTTANAGADGFPTPLLVTTGVSGAGGGADVRLPGGMLARGAAAASMARAQRNGSPRTQSPGRSLSAKSKATVTINSRYEMQQTLGSGKD